VAPEHDHTRRGSDEPPRPGRGRRLERLAIGALLGAAAFLGIGQWIEVTGGA
jgi:hypothetical protein